MSKMFSIFYSGIFIFVSAVRAESPSASEISAHFPASFQSAVRLVAADNLPKSLKQMHGTSVLEEQCDSSWSNTESMSWPINDYANLYALPCPRPSGKIFWRFYTEYKDAKQIFRAKLFATQNMREQWVGESLLREWRWDPEEARLETRIFFGRADECGSIHVYNWSPIDFEFIVERVLMRTDCKTPGPWPQVFPVVHNSSVSIN